MHASWGRWGSPTLGMLTHCLYILQCVRPLSWLHAVSACAAAALHTPQCVRPLLRLRAVSACAAAALHTPQ